MLYTVLFYEFSETLGKKAETSVEVSTKLTGVRRPTESPRACPRIMWEADLEMFVITMTTVHAGNWRTVRCTWKHTERAGCREIKQGGGVGRRSHLQEKQSWRHTADLSSYPAREPEVNYKAAGSVAIRHHGKQRFLGKNSWSWRRKWSQGIQLWDRRVFHAEMSVPKQTDMKKKRRWVTLPTCQQCCSLWRICSCYLY